MGRGRTTTGTVIACLVKLRMDNGLPIEKDLRLLPNLEKKFEDSGSSSDEEVPLECDQAVVSMLSSSESGSATTESGSSKDLQHRAFGIDDILLLRKITRLFDNGTECREVLDAIIDRCSAMQNIREAVLHYRKVFNQQHAEPRVRRVALNRGAEYLERYFRLIAFAAYLGSAASDGFCEQGLTKMTFKTWLNRRPEVQAMKWTIRLRPGRLFVTTVMLVPFYFVFVSFFAYMNNFIP